MSKPVALAPYGEAKFTFDALPPMRLAAPFERLRDRSDEILKKTGARPKVFLANLGDACGFHRARDLCEKFFRDRRHRGGRYRGIYRSDSPRRRFQGLRRRAGLPVLLRQGLCRAGRRRRKGPSSRRRQTYLSGRPARRTGSRVARGRRWRFHLCRRRCAGDVERRLQTDGLSMASDAKPVLTGGCQCGAIRFALSAAPVKISICHCRMCQKASGAPFASFADIRTSILPGPAASRRRSAPPRSPSAISAPPAARR